jgi:hypothetical protein
MKVSSSLGPQRVLFAPKLLSEALFAGFAHLDAFAPFGVEDLVCAEAAACVGVEDAVDDISTACLCQITVSFVPI